MDPLSETEPAGKNISNGFLKVIYYSDLSKLDYNFDIGIVLPGTQPSFFVKADCPILDNLAGLHILDESGRVFDYINFDFALPYVSSNASRVLCYMKIDLDLREGDKRSIVLVDGRNHHRKMAAVELVGGEISLTCCNPVICNLLDLLDDNNIHFTPLFIGGTPKSGTTWMEMLFNAHPSCFITGENAFWEWPVNTYNLSELPMPEEDRYIRKASVTQRPYSNAISMMGYGRAQITLRQISKLSGSSHVGDKTPGNALHAPQILLLFPGGHYIHCYRHPLDVAVSRAYHEVLIIQNAVDKSVSSQAYSILSSERLQSLAKCGDDIEMMVNEILHDRSFLESVFDGWLSSNHYAALAKRDSPDRVHFVSYEHLSAMPKGVITRLFAKVGLEHSPELIESVIECCDFNKVSGGRDRGASDNSSFFRKGVVGDYVNHFDNSVLDWAKLYLLERDPYFTGDYFSEY